MSESVLPKISLRTYHTFGIETGARALIQINTADDVAAYFSSNPNAPFLILGEGSNVLFTQYFKGTILVNRIQGWEELWRNDEYIAIKVGSGVNWHQLVLKSVALGYGGLENLSLIPGTVGAAPIQNIGAYGSEVKDVIEEVFFYNIDQGKMDSLLAAQCNFGYRDSIFKQALAHKVFITAVTFRLSLRPIVQLRYEDIRALLGCSTNVTVQQLSDAVIAIRKQKLPDPAVLGNSGSFFKNPVITKDHFLSLQQRYPDIKGYATADGVKVAAAWLIERCGWKGYRQGDAGVHDRQALVLVNHGKATGKEILELSSRIMSSVKENFEIDLEREVQIH